jgi:arylsulfatase A-like enzyme
LLEAVDVPVPADVQGSSFLRLFSGDDYVPNEQIFAEKNTIPDDIKRCIRTERYKYIRNYNEGPRLHLPLDIEITLTRRDMGDEHLEPRPPVELYDLLEDPWEMENLVGRTGLADVENELASRLQKLMVETNDPLLSGPIPRPPEEAGILQRLRNSRRH